jgi:hypothetical protein
MTASIRSVGLLALGLALAARAPGQSWVTRETAEAARIPIEDKNAGVGTQAASASTASSTQNNSGSSSTALLPNPASSATITTLEGVPFFYQVTSTGPVTFAASGLPSGVSIDPLTGVISGTPVDALGISTVTVTESGVTGTQTIVLSLAVLLDGPSILTQPQSVATNIGFSFALSVDAVGNAGLSYQWFHDGAALPAQVSEGYIKGNVTTADAGSYTVVVSDFTGSVSSAAAVVTVMAPSFSSAPAGPASGGGGGGGGGGSPSVWFYLGLLAAATVRFAARRRPQTS